MSDLRERVPGHSLIDELLRQWDLGTIHIDSTSSEVVIDDDAVGWYQGVLGERRVAEQLDRLGDGWTVLHSVPVGRGASDIDHVVIGQAGVFTINTKYSPGKTVWVAGYGLYVDGHPQRYVRNSVTEAARASDLLSKAVGMTVPTVGLIVFVDPGRMTLKSDAGGGEDTPEIRVLHNSQLPGALRGRPIFSPEQVARIVAIAVKPETWHSSPIPSTVGVHISREFEALEAEVGPRLVRKHAPAASPQPKSSSSAYKRNRPAPARKPSPARLRGRRPKRSRMEKLLSELLMPIVGLAVAWGVLQYFAGR
jgi:hypothetical protein